MRRIPGTYKYDETPFIGGSDCRLRANAIPAMEPPVAWSIAAAAIRMIRG
jgi:hypothetical protein